MSIMVSLHGVIGQADAQWPGSLQLKHMTGLSSTINVVCQGTIDVVGVFARAPPAGKKEGFAGGMVILSGSRF
jgi:hypothetical protein